MTVFASFQAVRAISTVFSKKPNTNGVGNIVKKRMSTRAVIARDFCDATVRNEFVMRLPTVRRAPAITGNF